MESKVARRYAEALYQVAVEQEFVSDVESNLNAVVQALRDDSDFRDFMFAPQTSREDKLKTASKIFADKMTAPAWHVIRLMIEKRREEEIEAMVEEFITLRRENSRVLFATITSSAPLDEKQKTALIDSLKQKSGKAVEANFSIDPKLIGGLKVAFGTTVLDGSVRGRLSQMRDMLRHDTLKQA